MPLEIEVIVPDKGTEEPLGVPLTVIVGATFEELDIPGPVTTMPEAILVIEETVSVFEVAPEEQVVLRREVLPPPLPP